MSEELAKKYRNRGYTAPSFLRDAVFKILSIFLGGKPLKNCPDLRGKRIALLNLGGIGDLTFTIPILKALREQIAPAEIIYITAPDTGVLFDHSPLVDRVLSAEWLADFLQFKSLFRPGFWLETFQSFKALLTLKPDIFICFNPIMSLPGGLKYALVAYLTRAPVRCGLDTQGRGFFLNLRVNDPGHLAIHDIERFWVIAKKIGLMGSPPSNALPYSEEDRIYAQEILKREGVAGDHPLIVFHLGGGRFSGSKLWQQRRWSLERFAELADRLRDELNARVLIVGSKKEDSLARQVIGQTHSEPPPINLTGKTTLGQLVALLDLCDAVVSTDSGVMHLSAGLNVHTFAIFGFSDYIRSGPWGPNNHIISLFLPCSPCVYWFKKRKCPDGEELACLRRITTDFAMQKIKEALKIQQEK